MKTALTLRMARGRHLVERFFWSLSSDPPEPAGEAWLVELLTDKEAHLYKMMSPQDQRHAIECGREALLLLGDRCTDELIDASALHDVGKTPARLGTIGRATATVLKPVLRPRSDRWVHKTHLPGRWQRYLAHDVIGAEMLEAAGSSPRVVAWAAEHHKSPSEWTLPDRVGRALAQADGEQLKD